MRGRAAYGGAYHDTVLYWHVVEACCLQFGLELGSGDRRLSRRGTLNTQQIVVRCDNGVTRRLLDPFMLIFPRSAVAKWMHGKAVHKHRSSAFHSWLAPLLYRGGLWWFVLSLLEQRDVGTALDCDALDGDVFDEDALDGGAGRSCAFRPIMRETGCPERRSEVRRRQACFA
jgi:hypothetical protein